MYTRATSGSLRVAFRWKKKSMVDETRALLYVGGWGVVGKHANPAWTSSSWVFTIALSTQEYGLGANTCAFQSPPAPKEDDGGKTVGEIHYNSNTKNTNTSY